MSSPQHIVLYRFDEQAIVKSFPMFLDLYSRDVFDVAKGDGMPSHQLRMQQTWTLGNTRLRIDRMSGRR